MLPFPRLASTLLFLAALAPCLVACESPPPPAPPAAPPPAVRARMDRLTVAHAYDPSTGFIVARETIALPPLLADAPPLDAAIAAAGADRIVIAFATADRCAPCQQFKKDALNDAAVIARLAGPRFVATHVEVDRAGALADASLDGRSIPMSYALRDGRIVSRLRGQRSAAEVLAWLDSVADVSSADGPT